MALSLLLLVTSGLFLRSLQSATDIDPGFDDPAHLATLAADPGLQGYDEAAGRAFWDRMLRDVGAIPGVRSVALTWTLPLGLNSSDQSISIPGYEFAPDERNSIPFSYVSEGYFEAMGIDVVEGRTFGPLDDADGAPVIIVNRRFAERFWPNESALGRTVTTGRSDREVVGVVETGKYGSLGEDPLEFMYMPYRDVYNSQMTVVARTDADPQDLLTRMRTVAREIDPDLPVYDARSMEDHMGVALLPARLGGSVLGVFGLLGLTLAAVGIYGVMSYSVSQRKREIGIRVAMGADRATVLRLVLEEGMRLALTGALIGVVGAFGAARLVQGLLYDVSLVDPIAFAGVPIVLIAVATLAVYLPARRAAAVDPMKALKAD
jgi:predicted permease